MRRAALVPGILLLVFSAGSAFAQVERAARGEATARRAFVRFLEARLEQPEWVARDTVGMDLGDDCGAAYQPSPRLYWMASYRVVSVRTEGNRAVGVVDVLAAGEQGPDPFRSYPTRARLRVAHHLLRFSMRREPRHGRWVVCETATNGWQLGHDIIPHNMGIDPDLIFAAIDSIRGVPHRRWYTFLP